MSLRLPSAALLFLALVALCRQHGYDEKDCVFSGEDEEAFATAVNLVQASVTLVKDVRHNVTRRAQQAVLAPSSEPPSSAAPSIKGAAHISVLSGPENMSVPSGSDIWKQEVKWISVAQWHPTGVISTLGPIRQPMWKDVSYISLNIIVFLCSMAYPAILVGWLLLLTILVSFCLVVKSPEAQSQPSLPEQPEGPEAAAPPMSLFPELPVVPKQRLTTTSKSVYACWAIFCCTLPSMMVFGTPILMVAMARPYPQEVLIALTLLTSVFIFANSTHMAVFAGRGLLELSLAKPPRGDCDEVQHWLILPQYKEEVDVVSMALRSVAQSGFAKSSIGVVLAFEEREAGAAQKAELLKRSFEGQFQEIVAVYHPAGLPNDPPGKASNLCWAFKELLKHIQGDEDVIKKTVLTVADADSEFSAGYFEALTTSFLNIDPGQRRFQMWQSPVFHMKNYHRQPAPVVVGTVFTAMQELSMLADTNAVRFPYSTYSLSMSLARDVGGWDPDWIAEDYHMGIKCFLMTLGRSRVEPVLLATMNYVPEEDDSWWGTCMARWTQLKRHALGFSDFSYYFMMLPLVFAYVTTQAANKKGMEGMVAFWRMLCQGTTLLVRLLNVHVLIGVLSTYGVLEIVLKFLMKLSVLRDRWVDILFVNVGFIPSLMMLGSVFCTVILTLIFFKAYLLLANRIEGESSIKSPTLHWIKIVASLAITSPIYFVMLAYAIWCAALNVLTRSSFEYHVAPKPTLNGNGNAKSAGNPFDAQSKD